MIYKELTIVHGSLDNNWAKVNLFEKFIKQSNFTNGTVKFKEFKLKEYPVQEEAYSLIDKTYKNRNGEYYWCGTKYETLEDIFNALNKQKIIIEITADY